MIRNKKYLIVLLFSTLLVVCAKSQSLDSLEVITRFFEANGGEANWRAVKSLHRKSTYTKYKNGVVDEVQGTEWIVKGENHQRVNYSDSTEGFDEVLCLNDSIFWRQSIFGNREILPDDHAKYYKATMGFSIVQFFMKPDADISFLGIETLFGKSYYSFRLKLKGWSNGAIYHLDTETYLITYSRNESSKNKYTKHSDYRQVGSVLLPYLEESYRGLDTVPKSIAVVYSIEINTIKDNSVFQFSK